MLKPSLRHPGCCARKCPCVPRLGGSVRGPAEPGSSLGSGRTVCSKLKVWCWEGPLCPLQESSEQREGGPRGP